MVQDNRAWESVWPWYVYLWYMKHPLTACCIGVYFAKDGAISLGGYAAGAQSCWRNSAARITNCVALAEIVNLPQKFVSTNPYFVVDKTEWIIWCVS